MNKKEIKRGIKNQIIEKLDHVTVDSLKDYRDNKAFLRQTTDTVTIPTVEPTNTQASKTMPGVENSGEDKGNAIVQEAMKMNGGNVLRSLGINVDPNMTSEVVQALRVKLGELAEAFGFTPPILSEGEDDNFQDPDLFGDEEKAEREMEMNEDFDSVMNELAEKNAPSIDIAENINPRIKKGDLIEYLKKQK